MWNHLVLVIVLANHLSYGKNEDLNIVVQWNDSTQEYFSCKDSEVPVCLKNASYFFDHRKKRNSTLDKMVFFQSKLKLSRKQLQG